MTILTFLAGFLCGAIVCLILTWYALGTMLDGAKSVWRGK